MNAPTSLPRDGALRSDPTWANVWESAWQENASGPAIMRGTEARPMSRDADGPGRSFTLRLPPGWKHVERGDATVEIFVLEGAVDVAGTTLRVYGFAGIPKGSEPVEIASPTGAHVAVWHNEGLPGEDVYPDGISLRRTWQDHWEPYEVPGLRHGMLYKGLRQPDKVKGAFHGGPRGMLRLHLITPGYPSVQEEIHENCAEEILFIAGDLLMPNRGWGGPGTLLVNPPGYPHGPYVSQKGILLLIHSTSPMPTSYTDFPAGPEICAHYLETTPLVEHTCTDPWHVRPEKAAWEAMTS
jgi:hypothetical protein